MNDRYRQSSNEALGNPSLTFAAGEQLRDLRKKLPLRVLGPADFAFWQSYGYVIVRHAVPDEQVRRTVDFLWEFQELDRDDPETWDRKERRAHPDAAINGSGMVEVYQNQHLWDNRQTQRVYDAFVDIWDREDLWVSNDRANLNTPNRGARNFAGFIHWDSDTTMDPLPINVQGVLALSDTSEETGGFQCLPELFRNFAEWRKTAPADRSGYRPDLDTVPWPVQFVPMKAGDLLIFNSLLAHGIRPNTSVDKTRLAQYIAFVPADASNAAMREERVRAWRECRGPDGVGFPGDPREWEKKRYGRATLTELGERILGARDW